MWGSSKHSILSMVLYVELSDSAFSTITIVAVAIVIILNRFTIVSLPIMNNRSVNCLTQNTMTSNYVLSILRSWLRIR